MAGGFDGTGAGAFGGGVLQGWQQHRQRALDLQFRELCLKAMQRYNDGGPPPPPACQGAFQDTPPTYYAPPTQRPSITTCRTIDDGVITCRTQ
jgi:hypothetical protein